MYGTQFVFPHPPCNNDRSTIYKIQLLPRGIDPVVVSIEDHLQMDLSETLHVYKGQLRFAELRNGHGMSVFIPCGLWQNLLVTDPKKGHQGSIITFGTVRINATDEILVHVMCHNDSFSVIPVNALVTAYTLFSHVPDVDPSDVNFTDHAHFALISPVPGFDNATNSMNAKNVTITITPSPQAMEKANGSLTEMTMEIRFPDEYFYFLNSSLTNYTISATDPIFVVIGCIRRRHESSEFMNDWTDNVKMSDIRRDLFMEHVRPPNAWGRRFVLMTPQHCGQQRCDTEITFAALCQACSGNMSVTLVTKFGDDGQRPKWVIPHDGSPHKFMTSERLPHMIIAYGPEPFQLLFTFISKSPMTFTSKGIGDIQARTISLSLGILASVAPVEQYYQLPCFFSIENYETKLTVVAGMKREETISKTDQAITDLSKAEYFEKSPMVKQNRTLERLWIRTTANSHYPRKLGDKDHQLRLWFHQTWFFTRYLSFYYLDGGFNLYNITENCTETVDMPIDGVDNNCNGIVDEHYKYWDGSRYSINKKKGEMLDSGLDVNITKACEMKQTYLFELPRYRLVRFDVRTRQVAKRIHSKLSDREDFMVGMSGFLGIFMVFVCIFTVWAIDAYERYTQQYYAYKIFF